MRNFVFFRSVLLSFIFNGFIFSAFAVGELVSTDARSFALGNLHALDQSFINPAALSFQQHTVAGMSVLNRFEMKELNTVNLYGQYPNRYIDAGFTFSHYGYEDYRIVQAKTGFAKKIIPGLSIGINLIYFRESSVLMENAANHLSSDVGIRYQLTDAVTVALLADNMLHTFDDRLWNVYGGITYHVTDNCSLLAESGYGATGNFHLSFGIEYNLLEQFCLRAGTQTANKTPSFGIAYHWNRWVIDTGFSLHPTLGLSSIIELKYQF
jgi:hypothetical protein